ncbi:MAG: glutamine--fructose-6-phosphate transaminase (isomerizing) [Desulfurococcales archaeon]|nr:glutamine--fructose-6-phosphate transaminase (isomerizing) [Desulfurococcales archaeon]
MCGIIGIVSREEDVVPRVVDGLKRLEYRGYDSVGVAVVSAGSLVVRKSAGKLADVVRKAGISRLSGGICIGHTRWATHGPPIDVNAHPHVDCSGSIAVVHNGVIRNFSSLREQLESRGHTIRSDTDTELIAHLLEEGLREGLSPLGSMARALSMVTGSYAIAVLFSSDPGRIYFARMHSPLILGLGEGSNAVASDVTALLDVARRVVPLNDGELGWISATEVALYRLGGNGELVPISPAELASRIKVIEWTPESASKAGYPHFMIKEIYEQPQALLETYNGSVEDPSLARSARLLVDARRVYVVGAGTSYHAGLVFSYMAATLARVPVYPVIASEHPYMGNAIGEGDVVIAVSQSGETYDTLEAVRDYKKRGARVIGVINVVYSALDRESDISLYTRAGPEIGVAATKTFLSQVMLLELLATFMAEHSGALTGSEALEYRRKLGKAPRITQDSIAASDPVARFLGERGSYKSVYVLGRGLGSSIAKEASLKLKEIAYMHAEAYPAGESKHGPIALVEKGFPVFMVATSDSPHISGNAMEMSARGAEVVVTKPADLSLEIPRGIKVIDLPPSQGFLPYEPFILTPFYQLLSYYSAVAKGYDPDKPRNLAKTVTVE